MPSSEIDPDWAFSNVFLAKLLRNEIVSPKQLNAVLTHSAKLYSPLAARRQFSWCKPI